MMTKKTAASCSPEVRERAVRRELEDAGDPGAMGGDQLDRGEDRLHGGEAAALGPAGRAGPRQAGRADARGA